MNQKKKEKGSTEWLDATQQKKISKEYENVYHAFAPLATVSRNSILMNDKIFINIVQTQILIYILAPTPINICTHTLSL
jgi:hypothetical protein